MKKLQKLDEFKKFAILKKGIGIESQNLCKQFNDQKTIQTRWNSTVAIEQKVDSKAFAIPILTASHSKITLIIRCATDAIKKSHYYELAKLTTAYGITVYS